MGDERIAGLLVHDALESIRGRLEAFSDAIERLATRPGHHALADEFECFVSDCVRRPLGTADLKPLAYTLGSFSGRLSHIDPGPAFRNLAFELMQFAEDCERAGGCDPGENGPAAREAMPEAERVAGFQALVASDKGGGYLMEDADGEYRAWEDMSAAGRLRQIASNAMYYCVPFEPFARAARDALGTAGASPLEDAALRLVWRDERELHDLAGLIPDDRGTEPGPPLVEFFRGVMAERAAPEGDRAGLRQLFETLPAPAEPTPDPVRQQDRSRDR